MFIVNLFIQYIFINQYSHNHAHQNEKPNYNSAQNQIKIYPIMRFFDWNDLKIKILTNYYNWF